MFWREIYKWKGLYYKKGENEIKQWDNKGKKLMTHKMDIEKL